VRAVATVPELDPYRTVRREKVLGPLEKMPTESNPPAEPHVFAYLGQENPLLEPLVQCLVEQPFSAEVYLRGNVESFRRFLAARGVRVHKTPPPLAETLPKASLVISQAGSTMAHAALFAGRPQILTPTHLEQELTADALVALGVGLRVKRDAGKAEIAAWLRQALDSGAMRHAARRRAAEAAAYPVLDAVALTASACVALTG
jgi:UDP-N-acetylglucosamine:LPS N-acetylglucosamine transferase